MVSKRHHNTMSNKKYYRYGMVWYGVVYMVLYCMHVGVRKCLASVISLWVHEIMTQKSEQLTSPSSVLYNILSVSMSWPTFPAIVNVMIRSITFCS